MNPLAKRAIKVHERLLEFYGEPVWRNPLPAIDELVSTILSQNTNDVNRDRAFEALRARFPTWAAVRDAAPAALVPATGRPGQPEGAAHPAGIGRDHGGTRRPRPLLPGEPAAGGGARLADEVQRRR